tara:strand:- start:1352 stop:1573 length:222 start_codon:yes stop_codon:yes gene_type:complete
VFSSNPLILFLGLVSFGIFFYLLRIRASKNQIESFENKKRMNWSWLWLRYGKDKSKSNVIEGEVKEVNHEEEK